MLTRDPATKHFFWDGVQVPGVHTILRATGQAKDFSDVPEFYRQRGQAAMKAIELWVKKDLDEGSVDDVIKPYFDQFKAWVMKEKRAGIVLTESPYYSESLKFVGVIDLICNQTIYDIKCSKKMDKAAEWTYQMQGAAYRTLIKENMGLDLPFKILLLSGEGDAKEIPLFSPLSAWEAIMAIYNIKMARDV